MAHIPSSRLKSVFWTERTPEDGKKWSDWRWRPPPLVVRLRSNRWWGTRNRQDCLPRHRVPRVNRRCPRIRPKTTVPFSLRCPQFRTTSSFSLRFPGFETNVSTDFRIHLRTTECSSIRVAIWCSDTCFRTV